MHKVLSLLALPLLTSCSLYPLPEDVTGVKTPEIVRHIRCEARDGIEMKIKKYLDDIYNREMAISPDPANLSLIGIEAKHYLDAVFSKTGNDRNTQLADELKNIELKPASKRTAFQNLLLKYKKAAVALDFTLDMTFTDSNSATLNLTDPFKIGSSFGFGLAPPTPNASASFARENIRHVNTVDTFEELFSHRELNYCTDNVLAQNDAYPITGKIGLDKTISDFIDLNEAEHVSALGASDKFNSMADTLTFTTALSGGLNPTISLTPAGHSLQLSTATISTSVARTDKNTVIVALQLAGAETETQIGSSGNIVLSPQKKAKMTTAETVTYNTKVRALIQIQIEKNDRDGIILNNIIKANGG